MAFLLCSIASTFHSPFLYRHYFALLVPAAAAVGGAGTAWLADAYLSSARSRRAAVALAIVLTATFAVAARPAYWLRPDPVTIVRETLGDQGFEAAPALATYLGERTRSDDPLFVYGSEPQIAFLARRRDVNPFGMVYPLTWHWPRHREFQERVWAAIERDPPAYVVLAHTRFSLVRSPRMDLFLETNLRGLLEGAYDRDAVLVRDATGRFALRAVPPDARTEPDTKVFFELWRRRTAGEP
jgi:hypothetical protein